MKLTKLDKQYLKDLGVSEEDFNQIERASNKRITTYEYNDQKISREKAIELLGRETYWSGISGSAFHWTAARYSEDESVLVLFDSSRLFK